MNDARFSMRLPQATLDFGHGYAAQNNMTLTDLLIRYIERLRDGVAVSVSTPSKKKPKRNIDKYIGIVKGAENVTDEELDEDRFKYLTEKYA